MQRSSFKVLFYVKRQSEKSGQVPIMAVSYTHLTLPTILRV